MWSCFFFFQAEDGIRDHCVTGVQTCALPISSGTVFYDYMGLSNTGRAVQIDSTAGASVFYGLDKIGRASCRERVEMSVLGVSVEEKPGNTAALCGTRRDTSDGSLQPEGERAL